MPDSARIFDAARVAAGSPGGAPKREGLKRREDGRKCNAAGLLEETRRAYYERYRLADVFAPVTRAPEHVIGSLSEIPGVAAAEGVAAGAEAEARAQQGAPPPPHTP